MNTNELAEQATEHAEQTGENIRTTARDLAARARSKVREAGVATDYYVHEYAWTSLAIVAMAAGMIGYMIGRRER